MSEPFVFQDFIRRLRDGDQAAATELVQRYGSTLHRVARIRLVSAGLEHVLDASDICQSVLASFCIRTALSQYELELPEQLLKLLTAMARNKVTSQARKQRAECRDHRRVSTAGEEDGVFVAHDHSPSQVICTEELLREVRNRLSPEERRLAEMRTQGRDWADIAAEVGGTALALRKKLSRAADRVMQELGLGEQGHD